MAADDVEADAARGLFVDELCRSTGGHQELETISARYALAADHARDGHVR